MSWTSVRISDVGANLEPLMHRHYNLVLNHGINENEIGQYKTNEVYVRVAYVNN